MESYATLRCQAQIEAGITEANSKEGIDFCIHQCPYKDGCILFDSATIKGNRVKARKIMADFTNRLYKHGVSVKDIGMIIGKDKRTVHRLINYARLDK